MTPTLKPLPTVVGGLVLALLLTACGGDDDAEQEPDTEAAEADGDADGGQEQDVELVDPMQLAPDNLCEVLSDDLYDDLLDDDGSRDYDESGNGVPDPDTLENLGKLMQRCMSVAVETDPGRSYTASYQLEISEGLHADDPMPPLEEDDADPSLDLGEYALAEVDEDGSTADLTVIDGQVHVKVKYKTDEVVDDGAGDYTGEAYLEEDELVDRAVRVAEEILSEVDSNR